MYFRIGEVAGLVGVEPHVLRYWEREFRSIRPTKSAKGQRVYSRRDVENLLRVRDLLYSEGFTIAGAKKRLLRSGVEPTAGAGSPSAAGAQPSAATSHAPAPLAAHVPPLATAALPSPAVLSSATLERTGAEHRASAGHKASAAPVSGHIPHARVNEKLSALRSEVEAFLKELGG